MASVNDGLIPTIAYPPLNSKRNTLYKQFKNNHVQFSNVNKKKEAKKPENEILIIMKRQPNNQSYFIFEILGICHK